MIITYTIDEYIFKLKKSFPFFNFTFKKDPLNTHYLNIYINNSNTELLWYNNYINIWSGKWVEPSKYFNN